MGIKFAKDIIKDIENRGRIYVPEGYVTGDAFEEWLYGEENSYENIPRNVTVKQNYDYNIFDENLGDEA